jgi:hypothetical protein
MPPTHIFEGCPKPKNKKWWPFNFPQEAPSIEINIPSSPAPSPSLSHPRPPYPPISCLEPRLAMHLPLLWQVEGSIIPSQDVIQSTSVAVKRYHFLAILDASGKATGTIYQDEGDGYQYQKGDYLRSTISLSQNQSETLIEVKNEGNGFPGVVLEFVIHIYDKEKQKYPSFCPASLSPSITIDPSSPKNTFKHNF